MGRSVLTGSFDRENFLYSGPRSMLKYFIFSIVGIFCLTMLLEYLYELKHHPELETVILPVGDGVTLSTKK